jgi:hypothetical protein
LVWGRVKGCLLRIRTEAGNPRLYENFEALAEADVAHHGG